MSDKIITIGKFIANNKFASMDLNYLRELKLLIMAMTGGGKSHGTRVILEEAFDLMPQIIIDGENEYYTLREKFPYLLFGSMEDNADVQIHPKLAEVLPETLMKLRKSAIIDISELAAHERDIFVDKFLRKLLDVPKNLRNPTIVVLDEAQKYCPEKGYGQSVASNAVKDFVARCRKRKFTAIFCTQRPAALSKDVTGACGMKLIGYAGQEEDRARNARELGMSTKSQDTMIFSKLGKPNYQFFAFGNGLSSEPQLMHFKESKTTHSTPDEQDDKKPPATPGQLKQILSELQNLPQQADQELKTQAEMKQKITKLEYELRLAKSSSQQVTKIDPQALQKAQEIGYQKGITYCDNFYQSKLKTLKLGYDKLTMNLSKIPKLADAITLAATITDGIDFNINRIMIQKPDPPKYEVELMSKEITPPALKMITKSVESTNRLQIDSGNSGLMPAEIKVLYAVLQCKNHQGTARKIAIMSEYAESGGAFRNIRGKLRSSGYIQYVGDNLVATEKAFAEFPNYPKSGNTAEEIFNNWCAKLMNSETKVLTVIFYSGSTPISKDDVAAKSEYDVNGGAFRNIMGRLRTLGLIEYLPDKMVQASKELMGEE